MPLWIVVVFESLVLFAMHRRRTLWGDELNLLFTAQKPLVQGLLWQQDYSAPLYQLILRPFLTSDTPPEWLLRAPALAFSIASLVAAWFFVKQLFSRSAAVIALAFIALSPLYAAQSVQARPYTLFSFLSIASMLAFRALLEPRRSRWSLTAYVAASSLLVYSHYYGFLVIAAQLAFAAVELAGTRDRGLLRKLGVAFGSVGVASLPALWLISRYLRSGAAGVSGWIKRPERTDLLFLRQTGTLFGDELLAVVFLVAIAVALWPRPANERTGSWRAWWCERRAEMLCLSWIGFGLYFLVAVSYLVRPIYVPRYGLPVMVPLAALLASALLRIRVPWRWLVVAALLTLPAARLLQLDLREDGRDYLHLVDALRAQNADQSPVLVGNLPYLPDFRNCELYGLHYYGWAADESESLLPLVRTASGDVALRDGDLLPRDRRVFVVTGIGAGGVEAYLQARGRAYRRQDFGTLSLIEIERAGVPGRWLSDAQSSDGPAPPRRTGE
ncbi:MAG TPA: glycosyltransferase family 39 protein [Myxococcota bacterium]|nr:glycosyltransferase family 39 protein [Myxococcota bacterium]